MFLFRLYLSECLAGELVGTLTVDWYAVEPLRLYWLMVLTWLQLNSAQILGELHFRRYVNSWCFWKRQCNGQMFILFENSRELFYWFCLEKNWKFTSVWNWHEILFIEVSFLFFSFLFVSIEQYLLFFGVGYLSTKCFFFLFFLPNPQIDHTRSFPSPSGYAINISSSLSAVSVPS